MKSRPSKIPLFCSLCLFPPPSNFPFIEFQEYFLSVPLLAFNKYYFVFIFYSMLGFPLKRSQILRLTHLWMLHRITPFPETLQELGRKQSRRSLSEATLPALPAMFPADLGTPCKLSPVATHPPEPCSCSSPTTTFPLGPHLTAHPQEET